MARLRSAPNAPASPPKAQSKRQALKEKTNTTRAQAAMMDEDDGNIEGLVKESTKRRGRPRKSAHNADELVMAGGLGQKEADVRHTELEAISTDELAKSDAPGPPTVKPSKRPPRMTRKPVHNEAQSKVLDGLKKRMEETARKEAGKKGALPAVKRVSTGEALSSDALTTVPVTVRRTAAAVQERSEYDIEPSPPPPGKLSSVKKRSSFTQPTSSLKPHSTPAMDASVLKNFKRRPRQPSMLAMVQQRTMSARLSLANATTAEEDPSIFDFDAGSGEDEDDFAPEAEGTPLHVNKAKRKSAGSSSKKPVAKPAKAKPALQSRKRKSDEANLSSGALESLRAKRQKSDAPVPLVEDDDDPLAAFQREPTTRHSSTETARQPTPIPQDTSDLQVLNSSQSTPPPAEPASPGVRQESLDADFAVPSTEEQYDKVQHDSDDDLPAGPLDAPNGTMAEPASSSPAPDVVSGTQLRLREELADPVTQVSPQPVKQNPRKEKTKPMSTTTLQSLLPKRRQPLKPRHRKSEYDFDVESEDEAGLDASHLEEDEDELGGRLRRQTKTTPAKRRRNTAAAKVKGRQSKAPQHTRKSSAATPAKKLAKTYGRAAAPVTSDKEIDDDGFQVLDEEDSAELPAAAGVDRTATKSKELEAAKRKFAEVDEWDMEFESLGDEDHRSSSQQWR